MVIATWNKCVGSLMGVCWFVTGVGLSAAVPRSENLLPDGVEGYFSVVRIESLQEAWDRTSLGELSNEGEMQPFAEDLRRQLEEKLSQSGRRLGITASDLEGVATGEVAVALLRDSQQNPAVVLIADVTDRRTVAGELLERIAKNVKQQGGKRTAVAIPPLNAAAVRLDAPPRPNSEEHQTTPRTAFYLLKDDLLVASDSAEIISGVLTRLTQTNSVRLGDAPNFKVVMDRCRQAAGGTDPHIRWFVRPIPYAELLRKADFSDLQSAFAQQSNSPNQTNPTSGDSPSARSQTTSDREQTRTDETDYLAVMKNQGFGAIQAVGGYVHLGIDDYEMVHRTYVYAPQPWQFAMRMLSFPNGKPGQNWFTPPEWVPSDIASYMTFRLSALTSFDSFGSLFDELAGEEELWDEILESIINDPFGPQVNLRDDLIGRLGPRAVMIVDYALPIEPNSERILLAVETGASEEKALIETLKKSFANDPQVRTLRHKKGMLVWELLDEEAVAAADAENQQRQNLPQATEARSRLPRAGAAQQEALQGAAVTVAHGYLMMSTHLSYLASLLDELPLPKRRQLAENPDYDRVVRQLEPLGARSLSWHGFTWTDEQTRPAYELTRQNKMPEADTFLGRFLNGLLAQEKREPREQLIDGIKLPEFEVVRRYLGPHGSFAVSEPMGWFVVGFTLKK